MIGAAGVCAGSRTDKIVEGLMIFLETLLVSASLLLCVDPLLYRRSRSHRNELPRGEGAELTE